MAGHVWCGAKPFGIKTNPADENNLIDIAARCLLIEDGKSINVDWYWNGKQTIG